MVREYGILLAQDITNNYPMKTNKYIMVDLMLLGLTIALMIVFNVVFYSSDQSVPSGNETKSLWGFDEGKGQNTLLKTDNRSSKTTQIIKEAVIYKNAGNLDSALTSCNKALSADTSDAKEYYLRAVINTGLGKNYEAFNDYSKAVKLNPDFFQAYLDRGLLSLKEKQRMKAVLDFASAIKISPLKSLSFLISRSFKSIF
jgi:tetratricopeptide (TPR) repeat protein